MYIVLWGVGFGLRVGRPRLVGWWCWFVHNFGRFVSGSGGILGGSGIRSSGSSGGSCGIFRRFWLVPTIIAIPIAIVSVIAISVSVPTSIPTSVTISAASMTIVITFSSIVFVITVTIISFAIAGNEAVSLGQGYIGAAKHNDVGVGLVHSVQNGKV